MCSSQENTFFEDVSSQEVPFPEEYQPPHNIQNNLADFLREVDENHDSEDEGIEDYNVGGYHPVHVGEVLLCRYVVVQKLGWGHFSTVWLCKDFLHLTFVAIKIQKSSPHYMEAAFDEVEILQKCEREIRSKAKSRDETRIVSLLNSFVHLTPYGNHFCMVFQILRCNLLDILKRHEYQGIPMDALKVMAKQILQGLDFLHRQCGVIHTDLKPQNVMVGLSQEEIQDIVQNGQLTKNQLFAERTQAFQSLMQVPNHPKSNTGALGTSNMNMVGLSKTQKKNLKKQMKKKIQKAGTNGKQNQRKDSGSGFQDLFNLKKGKIQFNRGDKLKLPFNVKIADLGNACWKRHHFSNQIQTRQYRSPEVILGQSYNQTADIWSFACMMYEMLTGDLLFQPKKGPTWSKNDDHLAQMQELLGTFPPQLTSRGQKTKKYFSKAGKMKRVPELQFWPLHLILTLKHKIRPQEAKEFADFLLPMLNPLPQKRMSAAEALKSRWLSAPTANYKLSQQEFVSFKQTMATTPDSTVPTPNQQCHSFLGSGAQQDGLLDSDSRQDAPRMVDLRLVDRSFTDLGYIGYCDGIEIESLDKCPNWQFN